MCAGAGSILKDWPPAAVPFIAEGKLLIPRPPKGMSRSGRGAAGRGTVGKIGMKETENSAQEQYEKEKTNGYADGKYYTRGNRTQESKKCGECQACASRNGQIAAAVIGIPQPGFVFGRKRSRQYCRKDDAGECDKNNKENGRVCECQHPICKECKNGKRQQHTDDNGDNAEFSSIFHRYPPFFGKNLGKDKLPYLKICRETKGVASAGKIEWYL